MAKKLNRNLVGLLTLAGMLLLAVTGFALLANLPGQDPKAYEIDAKKLEDEKQYDRAMLTYFRAFQRDPTKNPDYLVKAAKCAIEDGKIAPAREYLRLALQRNPQLMAALELTTDVEFEVARLFPSSPQWNRVLNEARKLVKLDAQSALAHHAMGVALLSLRSEDDRFEKEGEASLKKALELDPTNTKVVDVLAKQMWGSARELESEGRIEEAKSLDKARDAVVDSAIAKCSGASPQSLSELKQLQVLFTIIGEKVDEGMAMLESLAQAETEQVDAHLLLGSLYNGLFEKVKADPAKAKAVLTKALEINPKDGRIYQELSRTYKFQRQAEKDAAKRAAIEAEEIELYKRGLKEIPNSTNFRELKNKLSRIFFYKELVLHHVDEARNATGEAGKPKREAALKSADEWLATLEKELDPDSVEARYLTAQIHNARGEYVEAIKAAEAAERIAGVRGHFDLEVLLGELYARQQQWGAARSALEKAIKMNPNAFPLQVRLAQIFLQQNLATQALAYLKPDEPGPRGDFLRQDPTARKLRMEAFRQLGQIDRAIQEGEQLTGDDVNNEVVQAQLLVLNRKYDEAETKLKAILAKDPTQINANRVLLGLYRSADRLDDARAYVKTLLARDPDNRVFRRMELELIDEKDPAKVDAQRLAFAQSEKDPFLRALAMFDYYANKDQFDEAAKHLNEAEQIRPEAPVIIDRQFRLALRDEDWARAETYAKKNAQLNLDGAEGKIAEGRLAMARKEYDRAIDLMRAGLQKFPTNSLGWTYLAEAYNAAGRPSDAKSVLQEALKMDPTNGFANRAMADMLLKEGDDREAEKYLQQAAKDIPDDDWVRRQLQIVKEKENPRDGIASREKLRQENPKDTQNLILLARLYALPDVAQFDKAAEVYREAYALAPEMGLAREMAGFYGREDVNRPSDGESLLSALMEKQDGKAQKAEVATYLGQFYELQKSLATADRHFRLAVSLDPSSATLVAAGEYYARTNRYRDSLEYYQRALKTQDDGSADAQKTRSRIIALNLAIGDLEASRRGIDEFLQKYPEDPQGMVYEGAYHRVAGDVAQARKAFDAHLEKSPDNAVALWQRGQLFMLMGKWRQAIDDLAKAKTFSPNGFGYQHRTALAEALLESGQGDLAISELRSLLEESPDQQAVAEALVDIYSRIKPPRYSDAENLIYTYMRKFPRDYKWPMLLGRLGERSLDLEKAVQAYQKAAELSRYKADAVVALLRACKAANRPQVIVDYAAEKLSTRMLDTMPLALSTIAWAYSKTNQSDKAMETYDKALVSSGSDVAVYTRVVREMVETFGGDAALEREKKRAEGQPDNIERQKVLINLLQLGNNDKEALVVAQRIETLAAKDTDITFSMLAQGLLLQRLGQYEEARGKYESVIKREPDNVVALNNIAYLLTDELGKPAEAVPYAERANRLEPGNPEILDTLGWALAKTNRPGEAAGMLLRAIQVDANNVAALYHLGVVHLNKGELEDARNRLETAKAIAQRALGMVKSSAEKANISTFLADIDASLKKVNEAQE
ncbi:MAG TPA: tetratricopeptide repeat protein [Phycisphaerae bacterium]|nr:tetratricopeptide repeat protein [Phycisphaerae bacterium]